ncbi:acyl-CoA thioesterase [Salibacterium aidingense]|uniref:acyl-CoA thioesterase n=1 Tax=Salibacterium aidingense TaxID=384933 RepID=UPI00041FDA59|nr:acyl-CoA thioesterase [Salibacterium aidingense]
MKQAQPMAHSRTVQTRLVLPPDTNHLQTIFGGKVLAYIDEIGALAAMKHCNSVVVSASMDSVDFLSASKAGEALELEAFVTSTGRTSMEVFVRVHSHNLLTGSKRLTTESFLTMVAVDSAGNPIEVPGVIPATEEEHRLYDTAPARKEHRHQRKNMK